jgi:hypothetical protein
LIKVKGIAIRLIKVKGIAIRLIKVKGIDQVEGYIGEN